MPRIRKASSASVQASLSFITNLSLRKKIEDAILTTSYLYLINQQGKTPKNSGISKEIWRMIILYSASIIEAVLLYLYKEKSFSIQKIEYLHIHPLPQIYQLDSQSTLVFAKQTKKDRLERELMLDNLLEFFSQEGIIGDSLKEKIDKARNIRNTFHLSKSRKGTLCDVQSARKSSEAVLGTIVAVNSFLTKNP